MTKVYAALISLLLSSAAVFGQTPVFPYYEAFDAYTAGQPVNGNGGLTATSHVKVEAHGVVGNCAQFQMAPGALHDSILSPLIGNLTTHSITSFYFRVVTYVGSTPTLYNMTTGDQAEIVVYNQNFAYNTTQYTINSSNQNTTSGYVKVTVPIPSILAGNAGWFRIIAGNTSGHTWMLEFDSLVVKDTLVIHPTLSPGAITAVTCRGDSTGSIHVTASGATPPYKYQWNNGDTTATITHLPAGIYSLTVTDSLGAGAYQTDTVTQPLFQLLLDSLRHTNVKCHGDTTGTAEVYPSGGTPNYTYNWSTTPAQTTQQAFSITGGNYTVTVTDGVGCTVTATTQIAQPATGITASISSTGSNGANGTATVNASGGTGTLTYIWSPSGGISSSISGLAPGQYNVTVTDSSGCTLKDSVLVSDLIGINDMTESGVKIYPNPASDKVYFEIDGLKSNEVKVTCTDAIGRQWEFENVRDHSINISSLAAGLYVVRFMTPTQSFTSKLLIQR